MKKYISIITIVIFGGLILLSCFKLFNNNHKKIDKFFTSDFDKASTELLTHDYTINTETPYKSPYTEESSELYKIKISLLV